MINDKLKKAAKIFLILLFLGIMGGLMVAGLDVGDISIECKYGQMISVNDKRIWQCYSLNELLQGNFSGNIEFLGKVTFYNYTLINYNNLNVTGDIYQNGTKLDNTYLRLDATNDPVTDGIEIRTDNTEALHIKKADGSSRFRVDALNDLVYTGRIRPRSDNSYDIGLNNARYRNMNLSGIAEANAYCITGQGCWSTIDISNWVNDVGYLTENDSDSIYLRLDTSNDPVIGNLDISVGVNSPIINATSYLKTPAIYDDENTLTIDTLDPSGSVNYYTAGAHNFYGGPLYVINDNDGAFKVRKTDTTDVLNVDNNLNGKVTVRGDTDAFRVLNVFDTPTFTIDNALSTLTASMATINLVGGTYIGDAGGSSLIIYNGAGNQNTILDGDTYTAGLGTSNFDFTNVGVKISSDDNKLTIGDSDDLELFHNSLDSIINNTEGDLFIQSGDLITIDSPTLGGSAANLYTTDAGSPRYVGYDGLDQNHIIRVYPYKNTANGTVYSPTYQQIAFYDDGFTIAFSPSGPYYTINYTWNQVTGADGYRLIKYWDRDSGAEVFMNYDFYADVVNNYTTDTGPAYWAHGAVITPSKAYDNSIILNGEVPYIYGPVTIYDDITHEGQFNFKLPWQMYGENVFDVYPDQYTTTFGIDSGQSISGAISTTTFGARAGYNLLNPTGTTIIGYNAGSTLEDTTYSTIIGANAIENVGTLNSVTAIGAFAGQDLTNGASNPTLIGYAAGKDLTSSENTIAIGAQSLLSVTTADRIIAIGGITGGNYDECIILGYGASSTDENQFIIGNRFGTWIKDMYGGGGSVDNTGANEYNFSIHSTDGFSTNSRGYNLLLHTGRSTGNRVPSDFHIMGTETGASGTTPQTEYKRFSVNGQADIVINDDGRDINLRIESNNVDNAIEVDAGLDQVQIGEDIIYKNTGSGIPYGNIYNYHTETIINVISSDTWYEVTDNMTSGLLNMMNFGSNHYIAVTNAGVYKIDWHMSVHASNGDAITGTAGINGVANTSMANHYTTGPSETHGGISGSGILRLGANDQVSLFVLNEDTATDISIEHAGLTITMVGG